MAGNRRDTALGDIDRSNGGKKKINYRFRVGVRKVMCMNMAGTILHGIRVLLVVCAAALAGCVGPRSGSQHVFQLKSYPDTLTEELAIEKARETFAKEGYNLEKWQLTRANNPSSAAPDGTADKYFDRFGFRPTEGRVHFTDGKRYRTVQVRLEGNRLVCFMFYGL